MTITYEINSLEVIKEHNGYIDVVTSVSMEVCALGDSGIKITAPFTAFLEVSDIDNFVSFNSLTKDIITEWVNVCLNIKELNEIKAKLIESISISPQLNSLAPPWDQGPGLLNS